MKKNKSFAEFFRVLKKGGRLSVFEPINNFAQKRRDENQFMGYDLSPLDGIGEKFLTAYRKDQKQNDPMTDFDERDLFTFSEQFGFTQIQVEFTAQMGFGAKFPSWDFFYEFSPNPKAHSLSEALSKYLTLIEKGQFISYLKPLVEHTHPKISSAFCYLIAKKIKLFPKECNSYRYCFLVAPLHSYVFRRAETTTRILTSLPYF